MSANQAAFLIYERFLTAFWAGLTACFLTIWQIFFECSFHTHFPSVDGLIVKFQTTYKFEHLCDRHTVSQHARHQLRIVPKFRVELFRKSFNGGFEATLIHELEVVAFLTVLVNHLNNLTLAH